MRSRVRLRRLSTAVLLPLVLVAGCSDDEPEAAEPQPETTATTEPSESPEPTEPTESPEPTEPTEPTEATEPPEEPSDGPTSPPKGLRAALLTAQNLPAPGTVSWQDGTTRRGTGPEDVSVCQVTDLEAIGASKGVHTTFSGGGNVEATHVVAQFVDEQGASGGFEILQAWLSRCAQQAATRGFDDVKAAQGYTPVEAGDQAGWSVHFYGPVPGDRDASYIEAQALVRRGDTLSWVVWTQVGQDYNYPAGDTPPERAIPLLEQGLGGF
jgi:hypothetical protein